ncbi:MAG: hypothetical protein AAF125_01530 [Chloroflexota bacterium]
MPIETGQRSAHVWFTRYVLLNTLVPVTIMVLLFYLPLALPEMDAKVQALTTFDSLLDYFAARFHPLVLLAGVLIVVVQVSSLPRAALCHPRMWAIWLIGHAIVLGLWAFVLDGWFAPYRQTALGFMNWLYARAFNLGLVVYMVIGTTLLGVVGAAALWGLTHRAWTWGVALPMLHIPIFVIVEFAEWLVVNRVPIHSGILISGALWWLLYALATGGVLWWIFRVEA